MSAEHAEKRIFKIDSVDQKLGEQKFESMYMYDNLRWVLKYASNVCKDRSFVYLFASYFWKNDVHPSAQKLKCLQKAKSMETAKS